jgi:hypothetical protein
MVEVAREAKRLEEVGRGWKRLEEEKRGEKRRKRRNSLHVQMMNALALYAMPCYVYVCTVCMYVCHAIRCHARSLTHSFNYWPNHSTTSSFHHSITQSLVQHLIRSIHSFDQSIHSVAYLITGSINQSLTQSLHCPLFITLTEVVKLLS